MGKRSHKKRGKHAIFHRRTAPGATPGTVVVDPESPHPIIRLIAYGPQDILEKEIQDPRELGGYLGRWPVLWVNIDGLGDVKTIQQIAEASTCTPLPSKTW